MKFAIKINCPFAKILLPAAIGITPACLHGQIPEGPPTAIAPSFSQDYEVAPVPGQPARPSSAQPIPPPSPFRYGSLTLAPDLSYQLLYETGVPVAPGEDVDMTTQAFTAGITAQEGTVWNLAYTARRMEYSSSLYQDGWDQSAILGGNYSLEDLNFQISQSFTDTSDPEIETGRQTPEQTYTTSLTMNYGVGSSQPSLEVDFGQNIAYVALAPSTYTWSNQDWAHFPVNPQVDLAIGVGLGYTHEDPGFDMDDVTPEAKISWNPTSELTLATSAGIEESRYLITAGGTLQSPVYSASISYQPSPTTTIGAGAARQVMPSLFSNEVIQSTSFNLQLAQRLLTHYYLSVQAGNAENNYISVNSALASERHDTTNSLQASISTMVFQRVNLSLTASRVHNSSSIQGFAFSSNQFGFQAALKY
jgi:hypothetical protein